MCGNLYSQVDIGVGQPVKEYEFNVRDCFNDTKYSGALRKDSVKVNSVIRGQRIWRTISLDNKENKEALSKNNKCIQISLFEIIKFGVLEKKLNVFSSDNFNDAAKIRLEENQIKLLLSVKDTNEVVIYDAQGNEKSTVTIENRYLQSSDIRSYLIKEDWFMSSKSGQLEKRIVAIAPIVYDKKTDRTQPLFWLYYNEWSDLLNKFEIPNNKDDKRISYAYAFQNQYFISKVSKENNLSDRSVKSVKHGTDAQMESDVIKQKVYNAEGDMFQN